MTPYEVPDVKVYAGDTLVFPAYTFKTRVEGEPESAWPTRDLSDWTFAAQWRPAPLNDREITLTVDDSAKADGLIVISASPSQTREMARNGAFDLQGTRGSEIRTFLRGETVYREDVTRG